MLVGVDVDGTFTDLALADSKAGNVTIHKASTTPTDASIGVEEGIPGRRGRGRHIKPVAVVEDPPQYRRAILKAAPVTTGAQPTSEPGHAPQIE